MTEDDDRSRREMSELLAKMRADLDRDTPFNRLYKRNKRFEEAFVNLDEPAIRGMRSTRLVLLILVLLAASLAPVAYRSGPWWSWIPIAVVLSYLGALGAGVLSWRATAYRRGWLNGRAAIYDAMRIGRDMGMEPEVVLNVEKIRDVSIPFI